MNKKKFLALFMTLVIVIGSIPFTSQKAIAAPSVSGTADDPYLINTASDFNEIRNDLNAYYEICSDINLSTYINWVPLGDVVHPFTGRIIGNGHKISGVTIGSSTSPSQAYNYTGLFGYVSKYGVIQDLGIDVTIYNGSGSDCGGLAGKCEGYIVNCYVLGNVVSTAEDCNTGGLVGENAGNLVNCYGTANITGGSRKYLANLGVGGLVGLSTGENGVTNCYTTGNVSSGEDSKVGAIVGYNYDGLVANCRWDNSASLRVNGSLVSPQAGANVGSGDGADINEASIRGLDTAFIKGSPAINIPYMKDIRETVIVTYLTFTEIMNLGRGAIDIDQLPSGVKASAWGQDSANTNNGYPIFSSASTLGGFSGGSGILTDPYIIKTAGQLDSIRNDMTAYYKLGNDIDLSSISQWQPIGLPYTGVLFNGVLDGNGYKISNYNLGTPSSHALVPTGIFNIIGSNGVVRNLGLDCHLYSGSDGSGLVSDKNWGIIDNCYVTGEIEAAAFAAALTIMNEGVIVNCYSTAKVTGSNAGGFSYSHTSGGAMANCCATGDVSSTDSTGGFISYLTEVGPINCYATGNVESDKMDKDFNLGAGGFGGVMPGAISIAVNDYWNLSASQTMAGTTADPLNGIYYIEKVSLNLRSKGLTSEVMKGAPTSISYYKSQFESDGTVTVNSFIKALNGGRGAIGKYFTTADLNKKVLIHEVSLAQWTYVPGVNDGYPIPLTPQTPEITTQAAGKTISSGNTISFHTAAAVKDGGAVSYQWQKSSDGANWANVTDGTGTATDTYMTSALATGNSGETYRCIITNTLCGVTSDTTTEVATITVKPSILPISQIVEAGNAVTFCVDSAGPYQWQVSTDGGSSWSDITSAKLPYYTTKVLAAIDSGTKYRCVIGNMATGLTSQVTTEVATVTVTDPTVTVSSVIITPATVSILKGSAYTFGASVIGINNPAQTVTWSISGNDSAGTNISSTGELSIAVGETATALTVKAVSSANPMKSATSTVTVTNIPATVSSVTITPKTVSAVTGSAVTFSAAVAGTNNPSQTVTWGVSGKTCAATVINSSGVLTIALDETASALTVTAVSTADITKFDTATVTVTSTPPPIATVSDVTVTPTTVSVSKGNTYTFSAAVTGTNNPAQTVTWSLSGNNSTSTIVSSSGVLAVAAGETATTLTVWATSTANNTISSTSTVTVTDLSTTGPTVDLVTVNPATATAAKGNTQSFSAAVTGSNGPSQTVTWNVSGNASAGTAIGSNGLLTVGADETATTLTVRATSADNTKSGTATVTVTSTSQPTVTVSYVVVSSVSNSVQVGTTRTFTAAVAGTNNPAQTVIWSVSGNNSASTSISNLGVLTIGSDETATSMTVTATSTVDSSKSGTTSIIMVYPNKTSTDSGQTTDGGGSSGGASGGNSTGTTDVSDLLPKLKGSDLEGWEAIEKKLEESIKEQATDTGADRQNGINIVINLNGITVVPKELIEIIQGQDVTVTLVQSDGIEWIINGKDIDSLNSDQEKMLLGDIDLKVTMGEVNLPQVLVDSLTGSEVFMVTMSIAQEGSFGFTATLRLNLDKVNQGLIANLYYINPVTNKLEFQAADKIGVDGNVDFDFIHASDYVIIIDNGDILAKMVKQSKVTPAKKTLYISGTKNKSITLKTGFSEQIRSAIEEGTCSYSVTYASSNTKVASVSSKGKIKAKKVGKATITTTMNINGTKVSFRTVVTVKKAYIKIVKFTKTMKVKSRQRCIVYIT